jgi:hypothetical protein
LLFKHEFITHFSKNRQTYIQVIVKNNDFMHTFKAFFYSNFQFSDGNSINSKKWCTFIKPTVSIIFLAGIKVGGVIHIPYLHGKIPWSKIKSILWAASSKSFFISLTVTSWDYTQMLMISITKTSQILNWNKHVYHILSFY